MTIETNNTATATASTTRAELAIDSTGAPPIGRVRTRALLASITNDPAPTAIDEEAVRFLTAREREVVALVGRGLSNDEIADTLCISPLTAKTHVSRAMTKLPARDRAQLVMIALRTGLTRLDDL